MVCNQLIFFWKALDSNLFYKKKNSFIYGEDVKFESPRTVAEFYHAADKYICMDALNFCKNYMIQKLDLQSSIVYIETAVLFNIPDLKKACLMVSLLFYSDKIENTILICF